MTAWMGSEDGLTPGRMGFAVAAACGVFLSASGGTLAVRWRIWAERHGRWLLVGSLGLVLAWGFGSALIRFASYAASVDLALHDNLEWNSTQGRLYEFWNGSLLAYHVTGVPLLALPFYVLLGGPSGLLFPQSVALVASAMPMYALARRMLPPLPSGMLSLALPLLPGLYAQHLADFHEAPFVALPFLLALLFFEQGRFRSFVAAYAGAGMVIEYYALALCLFGPYALLRRRSRRWVMVPLAVSISWLLVAYLLVMPHFRATAGAAPAAIWGTQYYSHLGSGPGEIVASVLGDPFGSLLANPLGLPGPPIQLLYLRDLLLPFFVVLPFGAPESLFALADLLKNLPTGTWEASWIAGHHSVLASAALLAGTATVLGRLHSGRPELVRGLAAAVLALAAFSPQTVASILTPAFLLRVEPLPFAGALALIGPEDSVVGTLGVVSHLSRRRDVYPASHPEGLRAVQERRAKYVLLDLGSPVVGEAEVYQTVTSDTSYSRRYVQGRVALFVLGHGDAPPG